MLKFKPLELSDRETYQKYTMTGAFRNCEYCFVDSFMWRGKYGFELCEESGFLFIRLRRYGKATYFMPVGSGDLGAAVSLIIDDARQNGWVFSLVCVIEEGKTQLEQAMPGRFEFVSDRDDADYLYEASDLINLTGKKYHAKRNFINRFTAAHENQYTFEPVTAENLDEVREFQKEWCRQNDCASNCSLMDEQKAITVVLDNFESLGSKGGILRLDGRIIAFTMGAPITVDTFDIQIEKANHEIAGAYPMINWEFAKYACTGYRYINREEDMGLEGLRKSKLSYYPAVVLEKYTAVLKDG